MIEKVTFKNFKLLRQATLPLKPFTLIVGANASGKSTALEAIRLAARGQDLVDPGRCRSVGCDLSGPHSIEVAFHWAAPIADVVSRVVFSPLCVEVSRRGTILAPDAPETLEVRRNLDGLRNFAFDARRLAAPVADGAPKEMKPDGEGLAGLLATLSRTHPDRFERMNDDLAAWLADFDRVVISQSEPGQAVLALRAAGSQRLIYADQLSDGTLYVLAILTLAHLPYPPPIVTIEEPDRGIHPRMLRRLQDTLYRLSYPHDHGDDRAPVQVIATTHSPYFLDLFKDHPQEIVIAEMRGLEADFVPLAGQPHIQEVLQDTPLGEAWYSGIIGGVPANS
jgi:predicted ATPase